MTHPEHYTDEPRTEVQFGVNSGDPAECCDPWFITDDEGTAFETAQVIVEPFVMRRTVTLTYGPWELVEDTEQLTACQIPTCECHNQSRFSQPTTEGN